MFDDPKINAQMRAQQIMRPRFARWYAEKTGLLTKGQDIMVGDRLMKVVAHEDDTPGYFIVADITDGPKEGLLNCGVYYQEKTAAMAKEDPVVLGQRTTKLMKEFLLLPENADLRALIASVGS